MPTAPGAMSRTPPPTAWRSARPAATASPMTVSDGHGGIATTTLSLTVTGANDGPVAVAEAATTGENTTASGNVLANDSDADASDVLTVSAVDGRPPTSAARSPGPTAPSPSTPTAPGAMSRTPPPTPWRSARPAATASPTTVSDGHGGTATTTLSLTVTGANDGPVAVADSSPRRARTRPPPATCSPTTAMPTPPMS